MGSLSPSLFAQLILPYSVSRSIEIFRAIKRVDSECDSKSPVISVNRDWEWDLYRSHCSFP